MSGGLPPREIRRVAASSEAWRWSCWDAIRPSPRPSALTLPPRKCIAFHGSSRRGSRRAKEGAAPPGRVQGPAGPHGRLSFFLCAAHLRVEETTRSTLRMAFAEAREAFTCRSVHRGKRYRSSFDFCDFFCSSLRTPAEHPSRHWENLTGGAPGVRLIFVGGGRVSILSSLRLCSGQALSASEGSPLCKGTSVGFIRGPDASLHSA